MLSPRCPRCRSSRVQRGYDDPPLLLRLFGIYEMLCNNCNFEFRSLAFPGTLKRSRDYNVRLTKTELVGNRRRALRTKVRLPSRVIIYDTDKTFSRNASSPVLYGQTCDISEIGLATILPAARLTDRDLSGERRRLRIILELPETPVVIHATAVRYELMSGEKAPQHGWMIGARITKIKPEDRARLLHYLIELK